MYQTENFNISNKANQLIVGESTVNDNSVILLSEDKLSELKLYNGDIVLLEAKNKKKTVAIAIKNKQDNQYALINSVIRKNLGINIREIITIYPTSSIPHLSKVHILPFHDQISGINEKTIAETYLVPYFRDAYRPVKKGDCFVIKIDKEIEFKIIATEPEDIGVVGSKTIINSQGEAIKREIEDQEICSEENNTINGYKSIGGMNKQLSIIKTIVELQLKNPSILKASGLQTINGLLISGVSGSGKTLIVKALAIETGACIFFINGTELVTKNPEKAEEIVKTVFDLAEINQPSIILIEDIDCIAIKNEEVKFQMDRKLLTQLITYMDHLKGIEQLIVIGTTNRPHCIDPALKRFDRFDKEIELGIPNEEERMEILKIHTKRMKLAQDIDLAFIAKQTRGFVGADIAALCKQSVLSCLQDKMNYLNINDQQLDDRTKEIITVTNDNFKIALKTMKLSDQKAYTINVPDLRWEDIGELQYIKQQLQEIITWRKDYSKSLQQFGLQLSKNIILCGPPGCHKKSLAKALAGENSMNLIQIKGPLTCLYFKEIFNIAKYQQPCILLFDQFDQLFQKQETSYNNLIQSFYIELDDIINEDNIFFIGTSNKLDILEEYIINNDRFDQIIYVGLPDLQTRKSEFQINLKNTPISKNIDLVYLAKRTEYYSCNDIKKICQNAKKAAFKEMVDAQNKTKTTPQNQHQKQLDSFPLITNQHFENAYVQTRRSLSEEQINKYYDFEINLQNKQ